MALWIVKHRVNEAYHEPLIYSPPSHWSNGSQQYVKGSLEGFLVLMMHSHLMLKSLLNENLVGILGGTQCYISDSLMLNEC
jgi:hypothetical protein